MRTLYYTILKRHDTLQPGQTAFFIKYIDSQALKIEEYTGPFENRGLKDPAEADGEFKAFTGTKVRLTYEDERAFLRRAQGVERARQRLQEWNALSSGEKGVQS